MDLHIQDALERVIANPYASHCWIALRRAVGPMWTEQARDEVLQRLADAVRQPGLPQYYRAMVLDMLTSDPQWLCVAAATLAQMQPQDADRMAAFFNSVWQRTLMYARNRRDYTARLEAIGLPRLASQMDAAVGKPPGLQPVAASNDPQRPIRRVAVLAPELRDPAHPPTRMVLDMVEVLTALGYETHLFSANDALAPDSEHLLGNGMAQTLAGTNLGGWLSRMPGTIQVHSCPPAYSVRLRCHDMLASLEAFNPDALVFVGMYSPVVALAGRRWPLLGMATSSIAPMVRTDVWLTAQPHLHGQCAATWDGSPSQQLAFYYPFRRHGDPARRAVRPVRASAGGRIRLLTVGNVLASRISGEWARRMVRLLLEQPQVHWHLLGGDGSIPAALASLPPERIQATPHVTDMTPHWKDCDIYINPPGLGGGLAVAEAMDAGRPVVTFANTDGGDKVGADAVDSLDDYLALCAALVTDTGQRDMLGSRLAQRFDQDIDLARAAPHLRQALELAVHRFHTGPG